MPLRTAACILSCFHDESYVVRRGHYRNLLLHDEFGCCTIPWSLIHKTRKAISGFAKPYYNYWSSAPKSSRTEGRCGAAAKEPSASGCRAAAGKRPRPKRPLSRVEVPILGSTPHWVTHVTTPQPGGAVSVSLSLALSYMKVIRLSIRMDAWKRATVFLRLLDAAAAQAWVRDRGADLIMHSCWCRKQWRLPQGPGSTARMGYRGLSLW